MFEFRLHLYRKPDGSLALHFGLPQRLLFLCIAALLGLGMAASGEISLMGVLLCLASLFGGLFEDGWYWDAPSRTLTHRLGLLGLNRRRSWPAADITALELRTFIRGQNVVRATGDRPDTSVDAALPPAGQTPPAGSPRAGARKPLFATAMIGLAFDTREQGMVTIETHRRRTPDELESAAQTLADTLSVPLNQLEQ